MMDNILLIALLLLTASFFLWLAVRVKRHPENNYLSTGLAWVLAAVLEVFFDMKSFPSMLISATGLCLVLVIAKLRFTGEFSKAGFVTFAIGLAIIVAYFIVN